MKVSNYAFLRIVTYHRTYALKMSLVTASEISLLCFTQDTCFHVMLCQVIDPVVSYLQYCIHLYGGSFSKTPGNILKSFNFATRVISHSRKYDHISGVFHQLGWLNSDQFVEYFDLCLLYKLLSNLGPSLLASRFRFNRDVCERETKRSDQLFLKKPWTNNGKRTCKYIKTSFSTVILTMHGIGTR